MRTVLNQAFAVTMLAAWSTPIFAAPKMVPEEGAVQIILLRQADVHKDLKLTPAEIKKIDDFADKQWAKAQEIGREGEPERDREFAEMTKENERFIDGVLTKPQRQRLDEITLQVAGLLWVTRPGVASKLELTDEQKQKAAQLQKTARQETEELLHATKDEQKEEKLSELRRTSRERLMTLLTDAQEAKWRQMTGQPFRGEIRFTSTKRERK